MADRINSILPIKLEPTKAAALAAGGLLVLVASCRPSEPETYADCILDALKGTEHVKIAVIAIRQACRAKFPAPPESAQAASDAPNPNRDSEFLDSFGIEDDS